MHHWKHFFFLLHMFLRVGALLTLSKDLENGLSKLDKEIIGNVLQAARAMKLHIVP